MDCRSGGGGKVKRGKSKMVQEGVVNEAGYDDSNTKTSGEPGQERRLRTQGFFTKEINFAQGVQVLIAFFTSAC